jgi:quinol monooxygenase YgiN
MTMTMEFARFTVREGAEDRLVADRPAMVAALRERFPGCLAAYLTREEDGSWTDVIVWRSREDAEQSARLITSIPAVAAWLDHIEAMKGFNHTDVLDAWQSPT